MAQKFGFKFAAFAGLVAGIASPALADGMYALTLRGEVPTICRASISNAAVVQQGRETRGKLTEFCNSASGYKVYATPSSADLKVAVDGQALTLGADGRYLLSSAAGPTMTSRAISFSGAKAATVSITVVAA